MADRNFRYGFSYTTTPTVSATTSHPEWPVDNVLLDEEPKRPHRTTDTGTTNIVFSLGGTTDLGAIYINRTNYSSVIIGISNDNSSYTTVTPSGYATSGGGLLIPKDPEYDRRHLVVRLDGLTASYVRMQIPSGQTTDDGFGYYETGAVTLTSSFPMFPVRMTFPFDQLMPEPAVFHDYQSGGRQTNILGDPYAVFSLGGDFVTELQRDAARAIHKRGLKPFVFWPNIRTSLSNLDSFDAGQAYLVRRTSERRMSYQILPEIFSLSWTFTEVA